METPGGALPEALRAPRKHGGNVAEVYAAAASAGAVLPLYEAPAEAGFPNPAAEYAAAQELDLHQLLVRNPPATFFVRARGASMEDVLIFDGDLLVVDRSIKPVQGSIVVAAYDGNLYVKEWGSCAGAPALLSRNLRRRAEFAPIIINPELEFVCWGVATGTVRKL